MIQKLENAFLGILRVAVICTGAFFLAVFVLFAIFSMPAWGPEKSVKPEMPSISSQDIVNGMIKDENVSTGKASTSEATGIDDTNKRYYDRAANAIAEFTEKYSNGAEQVDPQKISQIIRGAAENQDSEELTAAFARNFSEEIGKALNHSELVKLGQSGSTIDVVKNSYGYFIGEFMRRLEKNKEAAAAKQQERMLAKTKATQRLYVAGGAFIVFLSLVFLLVFIRVERNLRYLEHVITPIAQ